MVTTLLSHHVKTYNNDENSWEWTGSVESQLKKKFCFEVDLPGFVVIFKTEIPSFLTLFLWTQLKAILVCKFVGVFFPLFFSHYSTLDD